MQIVSSAILILPSLLNTTMSGLAVVTTTSCGMVAGGDSEALRLSKSAKTMSDIALLREFARYFKTQSCRHEYLLYILNLIYS